MLFCRVTQRGHWIFAVKPLHWQRGLAHLYQVNLFSGLQWQLFFSLLFHWISVQDNICFIDLSKFQSLWCFHIFWPASCDSWVLVIWDIWVLLPLSSCCIDWKLGGLFMFRRIQLVFAFSRICLVRVKTVRLFSFPFVMLGLIR